nr:hypothetical protein [Tanacetum cinerariifolium]
MMMCKQEEKGVHLSTEQSNLLQDIDEESDKPTYDTEPLEQVQTDNEYNMFSKDKQHSEQPKTINDTYVMKTVDSNVIHDHLDMHNNDFEDDQNADDNDEDERVELANLIAYLEHDIDENKKIQKQLRKANETLTHELS